MTLVDGAHHITFLTDDMDRLIDFYARVFDAPMTVDMTEEGVRHVFIEVGGGTVLHPFQAVGAPIPPPPEAPGQMFARGRLDHFALSAPSEEAFREVRRRLDAEGASDGRVSDMGNYWILGYFDPDGFYAEVMWRKPGTVDADALKREDWTAVEI